MAGIRRVFLASVCLTAAMGLSACKPKDAPDPRLDKRVVATVRLAPLTAGTRTYTGIVQARVQSDLGFRVQGKIVERLVDTGQVVKKGQALMRLDPTDYLHAVTRQSGSVAALRAHWRQAAADERRYRGLVATGAVSASIYDQMKAASDSARAQLDAAIAQEKIARNEDDYSLLRADSDGVVVETCAEPGHVVAAGQTVIILAHAGPREASVNLPEGTRPALQSAAIAELYDAGITVAAHLRQLSDAADAATRTYEARYVMDGVGAEAPLGATVRIHLPKTSETANTFEVPLSAVNDEGKGPGVWVVNEQRNTVTFQPVTLTDISVDTATIHLAENPTGRILIAAAGGHELHDGERIRIASTKAVMQ